MHEEIAARLTVDVVKIRLNWAPVFAAKARPSHTIMGQGLPASIIRAVNFLKKIPVYLL